MNYYEDKIEERPPSLRHSFQTRGGEQNNSKNRRYLWVEDVQNGGAVGNAVEQHGESDGADHNDASVLGTVHTVRCGVAAVLRRGQQSIPENVTQKK